MNRFVYYDLDKFDCVRIRRSKSTLQYKSKQPHAPLRSHTFGSSSIHLFPKFALILLQVLAKRKQRYVLYQPKNHGIRSLFPSWEKQMGKTDTLSRKPQPCRGGFVLPCETGVVHARCCARHRARCTHGTHACVWHTHAPPIYSSAALAAQRCRDLSSAALLRGQMGERA